MFTAIENALYPVVCDLNAYLSNYVLVFLLIAVGLWYSIRTRFVQVRCFGEGMRRVFGNLTLRGEKHASGMSSFQALATAIAAQVGTGNIVGASGAILTGGPGAIFWMWVIAFFGMATIYAEATLALTTRQVDKDGTIHGGPVYYITTAFKGGFGKFLAGFFAVAIILALGFMGCMVQSNSIGSTFETAFGVPAWIVTVVAAVICGVVLIGGVKSIGKFCEKITPAMCLIYVVGALGVIIVNIRFVPQAFAAIFKYAFAPMPAIGGLAGSTLALALRQGAARGTFSNEAGCGSSPITHATAITDHPFKEGMYGSFEVFVDTIIVCTMTSLAIMCSGSDIWASGVKAEALTMSAFDATYGTTIGNLLVTIPLALFAFSTMVGWEINYESAFFYIFPKLETSKVFKFLIRAIWLVPGFIALGNTPDLVWTVVDIASGLWCIPNAIALIALSGVFMKIYRDYNDKYILKNRPISDPLPYIGKD